MNKDIQEDYVSFEVAKLLKEKGFDIDNCKYWNCSYMTGSTTTTLSRFKNEHINSVKAPTQALVIKWLRIKHNIIVETLIFDKGFLEKDKFCFQWRVYNNTEEWETEMVEFHTPEEATEAAILYTLQNLI